MRGGRGRGWWRVRARARPQGVILERHYVFKYCSPSRCALQSGRNPTHVNVLNSPIQQHNARDAQGGQQGMPLNMTGIAEKMSAAGYATHANFAGVLLIGLGCEANQMGALMMAQGLKEGGLLHTMNIQDIGGTRKCIEWGIARVNEMLPIANQVKREPCPARRKGTSEAR